MEDVCSCSMPTGSGSRPGWPINRGEGVGAHAADVQGENACNTSGTWAVSMGMTDEEIYVKYRDELIRYATASSSTSNSTAPSSVPSTLVR